MKGPSRDARCSGAAKMVSRGDGKKKVPYCKQGKCHKTGGAGKKNKGAAILGVYCKKK